MTMIPRLSFVPRRLAFLVVASIGLAACGSNDLDPSESTQFYKSTVLNLFGNTPDGGKAEAGQVAGLDPAVLQAVEASGESALMVLVETSKSLAVLLKASDRSGHQIWFTQNGVTLTLADGVLTATRGLDDDLLATESAATLSALRAGRAASYDRVFRVTTALRNVRPMQTRCTLSVIGDETIQIVSASYKTLHMAEVCSGADTGEIRNDFWLGRDKVIRQSRQWAGGLNGYLVVQTIKP